MSMRLRWPAMLLAIATLSAAQAAPLYKVSKLSGAAQNIDVLGLNNLGQAVGSAAGYSYVWSAEGTTQLHQDFHAAAINNHGVVAGTMTNIPVPDGSDDVTHHAYTYFAGAYKKVAADTQGSIGSKTYANAINDSGVVAGASFDGYAYLPTRFEAQQNTYVFVEYGSADAINASGAMAGTYEETLHPEIELHFRSFIYQNGTLQTIPTDPKEDLRTGDMNDANKLVGQMTSQGHDSAFLYENGQITKLDILGAAYSIATGINNLDQIVGYYGPAYGQTKPFFYDSTGAYDLNSLLVPGSGLTMVQASLNDLGQIAGRGCDSGGNCYAVLLSAVPEPQTWGMLLAGLGLVGYAIRRKTPLA